MVNLSAKLEISPSNHKEFHLYYLAKHSKIWTRRLHLIGTVVSVFGVVVSAVRANIIAAFGSVVAGVAICWVGDAVVEHTQPTAFKYPIWSVASNFKMVSSMLKGDMGI
ncbi:hypothetical protein JKF63_07518 [Porcisia hertigi]|uniref:Uncharacterized protein n=1 Tax=Porcisia hertigi TaxID=2761500 RepID=A0A836LIZ7_9TRYP|nr:hypothetical protein JKF63_07518 [Porcisia hertigi]